MDRKQWTGLFAMVAMAALTACGGDTGEEADAPADVPAAEPAAPAGNSFASVQFPEGVTAEMATAGQALFNQTVCWTCHGQNGIGTPLGPPFTDQEWINIDGSYDEIVRVIHEGVATPKQFTNAGAMPAMGGAQLTEDQMRELAAYVFALSHGG